MKPVLDQEIIVDFEILVDELLKPQTNEPQIKELMEKLKMSYGNDPVQRIGTVLEKMNSLVFATKQRKVNHDLQEHT